MVATTELQAVNVMLQTLGESSTTTLSGTLPFEVNAAKLTLAEVSKSIQQEGFTFNTEYSKTVTTTASGVIDASVLHVYDAANSEVYSIRGDVLWSVTADALEADDIAMTVVSELGFDSVPEVARRFITIRAARIFADRFVGSEAIREFTERDEAEAKAQLDFDYGIKKEGAKAVKDAQYDAALAKLVEEKKESDDKVLTFDSTVTEKKIEAEEAQLAADILRHASGSGGLEAKTLLTDIEEQAAKIKAFTSQIAQSSDALDVQALSAAVKEQLARYTEFNAKVAQASGTLDTRTLASLESEQLTRIRDFESAVTRKSVALDTAWVAAELRDLQSKATQTDATLDAAILASSKKEVADKDKTFDSNVTDKTLELEEDRLLAEIARRAGTLDADTLAADIKEIEANKKEYLKLLARRDSTLDADTLDADLLDAQSHKIRAEIMNMDMEAKLAEDYATRGSGVNESMINGSFSVSSILNRRP